MPLRPAIELQGLVPAPDVRVLGLEFRVEGLGLSG